jgi:hypothetical protein
MKSIFVSIASYRDPHCSETLLNLFQQAKFPERIFVGLCEQNNPHLDKPSMEKNFPYKKQVRIHKMSHLDAKGPTYARYQCAKLFRNEDFFFQIDSHNSFVKDWDSLLVQMYKNIRQNTNSTKIIISHYPSDISQYTEYPSNNLISTIVQPFINDMGIISFQGAVYHSADKVPKKNLFIAAGFIFTTKQWLYDVPFDPYLDFLFTGEEILLSARSFTNGWDVYTPNKEIIFHHYTRANEPKIWQDVKNYNENMAIQRMKLILKLDENLKSFIQSKNIVKYGLGKTRTLKEFYDKIGYDTKTKKMGKPKIEFFCQEQTSKISIFMILNIILLIFIIIILVLIIQ